jgi:hypothetical protein
LVRVIAKLPEYIKRYEQTAGEANGKTENIDKGKYPVF